MFFLVEALELITAGVLVPTIVGEVPIFKTTLERIFSGMLTKRIRFLLPSRLPFLFLVMLGAFSIAEPFIPKVRVLILVEMLMQFVVEGLRINMVVPILPFLIVEVLGPIIVEMAPALATLFMEVVTIVTIVLVPIFVKVLETTIVEMTFHVVVLWLVLVHTIVGRKSIVLGPPFVEMMLVLVPSFVEVLTIVPVLSFEEALVPTTIAEGRLRPARGRAARTVMAMV